MKLAMRLTLDGLVRALRWKAHALAEDAEQRYRPPARRIAPRPPAGTERRMEIGDDRRGR